MQLRTDIAVVVVPVVPPLMRIEPSDRNFVRGAFVRSTRVATRVRARESRRAVRGPQCLQRMLHLVQRRTEHVHEHEQDRGQVAEARGHGAGSG